MSNQRLADKFGLSVDLLNATKSVLLEGVSYQAKVKAHMAKKGIKSLSDMTADQKKAFFNELDAMHTAKNESVEDQKGVAEGAPELLKKEMPLHRHAEKLLAQNGVSKDDPDYHHHLGNTIKHLRQFGNIDLINKQSVAEASLQEGDGLTTTKKTPTIKVTHETSGKELVVTDTPSSREHYKRLGYHPEKQKGVAEAAPAGLQRAGKIVGGAIGSGIGAVTAGLPAALAGGMVAGTGGAIGAGLAGAAGGVRAGARLGRGAGEYYTDKLYDRIAAGRAAKLKKGMSEAQEEAASSASLREGDELTTTKKTPTIKVTHETSGKELVVTDTPSSREHYKRLGYHPEKAKLTQEDLDFIASLNSSTEDYVKEETDLNEVKVGDKVSYHHMLQSAGVKVKKTGTVEKVGDGIVHVKEKDKYGVVRRQVKVGDLVKEETLDELNKDTMYSYKRKSEADQNDQYKKIGKGIKDNDPESANKAGHKFAMRGIGQDRAEKRLAKEDYDISLEEISLEDIEEFMQTEDYEQLDELGKETLGNYIKKRSHDVATQGAITRQHAVDSRAEQEKQGGYKTRSVRDLDAKADRAFTKGWKHRQNIAKAVDKLVAKA